MTATSIEWTWMPGFRGASWNSTVGCTRVSAGCDNCYAFALHDRRYAGNLAFAKREGHERAREDLESGAVRAQHADMVGKKRGLSMAKQYDLPFSRVQLLPERLEVPLRTKAPTCYFVDSMADLFHESVPDDYLDQVWDVMKRSFQHRFLILTKRPDRMAAWTRAHYERWVSAQSSIEAHVPPNIWLGTSVEDQVHAETRIPDLLAAPARMRFLSCEPLLGPLTLVRYLQNRQGHGVSRGSRVDWVIVGGESGPRARPMEAEWARTLVLQCNDAGVAPFVKQMGSNVVDRGFEPAGGWWPIGTRKDDLPRETEADPSRRIRLREAHGRDMAEWPEDLRVRTWP